jgi:hypothetical protein
MALPVELVLAHRTLGYVTVFGIAPLALLFSTGSPKHRRWGQLYLAAMGLLYFSGLWFTFARNEFGSWIWARNLAFNFSGAFLLLLGWRAMWRRCAGRTAPVRLDQGMRAVHVAVALALTVLGLGRHFPSFALGALALWFGLTQLREPADARALFLRHQRCMLGSYFYVLTVLSLVHLRAPSDLRWLWPALIGVPLIAWATRGDLERQAPATRAVVGIAAVAAIYVLIFPTSVLPP